MTHKRQISLLQLLFYELESSNRLLPVAARNALRREGHVGQLHEVLPALLDLLGQGLELGRFLHRMQQ